MLGKKKEMQLKEVLGEGRKRKKLENWEERKSRNENMRGKRKVN